MNTIGNTTSLICDGSIANCKLQSENCKLGKVRAWKVRAFTLLELILAMTVTCMLALSLYASMRTVFKARDSAVSAVEPMREAQIALDIMARDLANALPPTGVIKGPFSGVDGGSGVGDSISFVCVQHGIDDPDPTKNDGIKSVEYLVIDQPDGTQALVRQVTRNLLAQQVPDPDQEIICRNVTTFDIHYFADEIWNDDWDSTQEGDTVPAAVQITLEIRKKDAASGYRMMRTVSLPCNVPGATTAGGN